MWKASIQSTGAQRCTLLSQICGIGLGHCLCMCPDSCHAICQARLSLMSPVGVVGLSCEVCRWRMLFMC